MLLFNNSSHSWNPFVDNRLCHLLHFHGIYNSTTDRIPPVGCELSRLVYFKIFIFILYSLGIAQIVLREFWQGLYLSSLNSEGKYVVGVFFS